MNYIFIVIIKIHFNNLNPSPHMKLLQKVSKEIAICLQFNQF